MPSFNFTIQMPGEKVLIGLMFTSVCFYLKYIGLCILEAVGCAHSPGGNIGEAMPSSPFSIPGSPHLFTCHFVIFSPQDFCSLLKKNMLPNAPLNVVNDGHWEIFKGSQLML